MPSPDRNSGWFTTVPRWLHSGSSRIALALALLAGGLNAVRLAELIRGPGPAAAIALTTLAAVALALCNLVPQLRAPGEATARRPRWFLLGVLLLLAGSAAFDLGRLLPGGRLDAVAPFVVAATGLLVLALAVGAALCWPAERLQRQHWLPVALDLTTLLIAMSLGFWVYAVHPALEDPAAGHNLWLIIGYAVLSLVLLSVLLVLMFRPPAVPNRRGVPPLLAGGLITVILGIIPLAHELAGGGLPEPGFLGWTLLALAVAVAGEATGAAPEGPALAAPLRTYLAIPFASTGLIGLLLFTSLVSRELWKVHVSLLLPAVFLSVVLIVARQTIIARENLRLAQDMRQAKEAAESANASRLQFLANISHDLRTPLNGVLGCAQILLRDQTIAGKQKELLRTMQGCAEHLRNLINDLLDLSKLEADRLELAPAPCDLRSFFEALTRSFQLDAEKKGLQLSCESAPRVPGWIRADAKRLQQILGNLLHNAIKFTDHGSVRLRVHARGQRLVCEVQDTGCGILPDQLPGLFQPFHVVDERSLQLEGTGLGLSIAKKLARKMGGDIAVQSVISKGSTFTLDIPFEETSPLVEEQRTVVDYQGRRRRLLIVDDEPANRIVLRSMLEPLDFLIDEAGGGPEALRQIAFARPDVILLDLMMPGMDGFELCRRIAQLPLTHPVPCLAISAMAGEAAEQRCRTAGFRELLHKPVSLQLLLDALHAHAGIEWTFGVLQPPPREPPVTAEDGEIVPPAEAEVAAFLDLARRGVVRQLETRAAALAQAQPQFGAFARRVQRHARDFQLKELVAWLASLTPATLHERS